MQSNEKIHIQYKNIIGICRNINSIFFLEEDSTNLTSKNEPLTFSLRLHAHSKSNRKSGD